MSISKLEGVLGARSHFPMMLVSLRPLRDRCNESSLMSRVSFIKGFDYVLNALINEHL